MRAGHPWPEPTTGQIWTTLRVQSALDYSLGQSGGDGLIEVFTAGPPGMVDTPPIAYAQIGDSPAVERHVRDFFEQLEQIWPGVAQTWNGHATFGNAQADPNILASYSCWLVGQCTTDCRTRGARTRARAFRRRAHIGRVSRLHGGGAQSGIRAAGEILADYRIQLRPAG